MDFQSNYISGALCIIITWTLQSAPLQPGMHSHAAVTHMPCPEHMLRSAHSSVGRTTSDRHILQQLAGAIGTNCPDLVILYSDARPVSSSLNITLWHGVCVLKGIDCLHPLSRHLRRQSHHAHVLYPVQNYHLSDHGRESCRSQAIAAWHRMCSYGSIIGSPPAIKACQKSVRLYATAINVP